MSTRKSKISCVESVYSSTEAKKSSIFSRNSKVTEFLELCIHPKNDKEMESVLLKFWDKFKILSGHGDFSEIDVACMFVLNHAYVSRSVSLSTMSRSLFAYQRQVQVKFFENATINPSTDCFLKELRDFENLYTYSKCDEMLADVGLGSIMDGGLGLTLFLIKFGLMEFPVEDNLKGRKMIEMLVLGFNGYTSGSDEIRMLIHPDQLLYRMRHSDISFKRALIIFCAIVIVAEYNMHENIEAQMNLPSGVQQMKDDCIRKLDCLNIVVSATTETKIILRDIENFLGKILSALVHGTVCRLIIETARKLFRVREFHNPRSLKELARSKIRTSLQRRRMLSEQVNQLVIPDALKEYLLFQRKGIWNLLKENHLYHNLHKNVNESLFLLGNLAIS